MVLAYASTVHGIQGETADDSIVGSDVDAAGLYVGLTRGRHHNEAIAIGRTEAGARERLATTMLSRACRQLRTGRPRSNQSRPACSQFVHTSRKACSPQLTKTFTRSGTTPGPRCR